VYILQVTGSKAAGGGAVWRWSLLKQVTSRERTRRRREFVKQRCRRYGWEPFAAGDHEAVMRDGVAEERQADGTDSERDDDRHDTFDTPPGRSCESTRHVFPGSAETLVRRGTVRVKHALQNTQVDCQCHQWISRNFTQTVYWILAASRGWIKRLNFECTEFVFGRWGCLQRFPRPPSWYKGDPTCKGDEVVRGGEGVRGEGRGSEDRGGNYRLMSLYLGNISARNYQNRLMYIEVIVCCINGIIVVSWRFTCTAYVTKP